METLFVYVTYHYGPKLASITSAKVWNSLPTDLKDVTAILVRLVSRSLLSQDENPNNYLSYNADEGLPIGGENYILEKDSWAQQVFGWVRGAQTRVRNQCCNSKIHISDASVEACTIIKLSLFRRFKISDR
ncbi:hypothetical protein HELRODRAFT_178430 [Helobdella robusta]|uniref:Uncharacterized protein n=1 Tax=Helobdella robusta TaxID=6412 RepID=T1FD54_HELRO|nr:hypothetical protein HELRODRAFT_178430 [Helobdella robusta]ESN96997.1 hypothetical protein HELRODRAFT_178430 [Helobdella robusta]